jgi:hypothetical protein
MSLLPHVLEIYMNSPPLTVAQLHHRRVLEARWRQERKSGLAPGRHGHTSTTAGLLLNTIHPLEKKPHIALARVVSIRRLVELIHRLVHVSPVGSFPVIMSIHSR